jgi:hypothetical protein
MASGRRLCTREIEVILESDSKAFSEEENASQDEEEEQEEEEEQQQQQPASEWRLAAAGTSSQTTVHSFTGGLRGMKIGEAPHINNSSDPLAVFMLFFAEVIGLLVVETNRYYHQYLDTLDQGPSPLPDVSEAEMFLFLGLILQMGHCIRDRLADYWSTLDQMYTPFYSDTMKRDRFLHILRFLHFTDNKNEIDKNAENYD